MKKIFSFIIICIFLISCNAVRNKNLVHYLSTLENIKVLPPTKEESVIIDSLELANKKFLEKCQKNGGKCIDDPPYSNANFKTGAAGFRKIIYEQFKVNAESKEGENKILVTIGKKDSIESIVFLKYTDEDSKGQIERIFKSKELNQWSSATNHRFPVKTQFEISIFIKQK